MGLGIFCIDHLKCWLTAGSGAFCFSEGRICGKTVLNIRLLDATEGGGHSLSTEKFTNPAVHL